MRVAPLAAELLAIAGRSAAERGAFTVVLAGGRTPHPFYREVESLGSRAGVDWSRWMVLLSDERCLSPMYEGRNDGAISGSLPSLAAAGRIRSIPVELGARRAADAYERVVTEAGTIDLALLGLGADGHTAGIFPREAGSVGLQAHEDAALARCRAVHDAPGPFHDRVTLTEAALSSAHRAWFLVDEQDRSKDAAVEGLLHGQGVAARIQARTRRIVLLRPEPREGVAP